jgi:hypothetical protein
VTRMDEFQKEGREGVPSPRSNCDWRKSSQSYSEGNCIEVACAGERVFVRDSKMVAYGGPHLRVSAKTWESFIKFIKDDEIDL